MTKLTIRHGSGVVEKDLSTGELTIGRSSQADLTIKDKTLSRVHARFFNLQGQLFVEDLGSTNGVVIGGKKISKPALVGFGDEIQIGNITAVAEQGEAASSPTPVPSEMPSASERDETRRTATATKRTRSRSKSGSKTKAPAGVFDWSEEERELPVKWIVAAAAIVVVGLAAFLMMPEKAKKKNPVREGDLLSGAGTFELSPGTDLPSDWKIDTGSQLRARRVEQSGPDQSWALEVEKVGGVGELSSTISFGESMQVKPQTAYVIEAQARGQDLKGLSGVRLDWYDSNAQYLSSSVSAWTNSDTWTALARNVVSPAGASLVRLHLVLAGIEGRAFFDEIVLLERAAVQSKGYSLGAYTVRLTGLGELVVQDVTGPVSAMLMSKEGFLTQAVDPQGGGAASYDAESGTLKYAGSLVNPTTLEALPFDLLVSTDGLDLVVEYSISGGDLTRLEAVGFGFPKPLGDVALQQASGSRPLDTTERAEQLGLVFSAAREKTEMIYNDAMTAQLVREDPYGNYVAQWETRATAQSANGVEWGFRVRRKRNDKTTPAEELVADAEKLQQSGDIKGVLGILEGLATRESELTETVKARLNAVRSWVDNSFAAAIEDDELRAQIAARLESGVLMGLVQDEGVELFDRYDGHPERSRLGDVIRRRSEQEERFSMEIVRPEAESLLMRARALIGVNQGQLAEIVLTELIIRFPGTAWANAAQELLGGLRR